MKKFILQSLRRLRLPIETAQRLAGYTAIALIFMIAAVFWYWGAISDNAGGVFFWALFFTISGAYFLPPEFKKKLLTLFMIVSGGGIIGGVCYLAFQYIEPIPASIIIGAIIIAAAILLKK